MPTKAPYEVRFNPEPSLATARRQKLKSIIDYTMNEQDMPNIQGNALTSKKVIFSPPDGAEHNMNILDCDPNPTECMVNFILFLICFCVCLL